jgi:hypothetical protein
MKMLTLDRFLGKRFGRLTVADLEFKTLSSGRKVRHFICKCAYEYLLNRKAS